MICRGRLSTMPSVAPCAAVASRPAPSAPLKLKFSASQLRSLKRISPNRFTVNLLCPSSVADINCACRGCGMCERVCPNNAIRAVRNPDNRRNLLFNRPIKNAQRTLDKIIVGRISQMTDPSRDSIRHTFDIRAPLGRCQCKWKTANSSKTTPPVRWIYPLIFSDMSIGALSTRAWEAVAMAVAYRKMRFARANEFGRRRPARQAPGVRLSEIFHHPNCVGAFRLEQNHQSDAANESGPGGRADKNRAGRRIASGGKSRSSHSSTARRSEGNVILAAESSGAVLNRRIRSENAFVFERGIRLPRAPPRRRSRFTTIFCATRTKFAADFLSTALRAGRVLPMKFLSTTRGTPSFQKFATVTTRRPSRARKGKFPCTAAAVSA